MNTNKENNTHLIEKESMFEPVKTDNQAALKELSKKLKNSCGVYAFKQLSTGNVLLKTSINLQKSVMYCKIEKYADIRNQASDWQIYVLWHTPVPNNELRKKIVQRNLLEVKKKFFNSFPVSSLLNHTRVVDLETADMGTRKNPCKPLVYSPELEKAGYATPLYSLERAELEKPYSVLKNSIVAKCKGKMGIYCWIHKKTGKTYIGASTRMHLRPWEHKTKSNRNEYLYRDICKYGLSSFVIVILFREEKGFYNLRVLEAMEGSLLSYFDPSNLYNDTMSRGGGRYIIPRARDHPQNQRVYAINTETGVRLDFHKKQRRARFFGLHPTTKMLNKSIQNGTPLEARNCLQQSRGPFDNKNGVFWNVFLADNKRVKNKAPGSCYADADARAPATMKRYSDREYVPYTGTKPQGPLLYFLPEELLKMYGWEEHPPMCFEVKDKHRVKKVKTLYSGWSGVYAIIYLPEKKRYVGRTNCLGKRPFMHVFRQNKGNRQVANILNRVGTFDGFVCCFLKVLGPFVQSKGFFYKLAALEDRFKRKIQKEYRLHHKRSGLAGGVVGVFSPEAKENLRKQRQIREKYKKLVCSVKGIKYSNTIATPAHPVTLQHIRTGESHVFKDVVHASQFLGYKEKQQNILKERIVEKWTVPRAGSTESCWNVYLNSWYFCILFYFLFFFLQFFEFLLVFFRLVFLQRKKMILYLFIMIRATIVPLLLAVAFLTLVERKVMGHMQRRVGPAVFGAFGVLQPFLDGRKLLLKEPLIPSRADNRLFLWAPVLTFLTSQILWRRLPTSRAGAVSDLSLGTMYVLAVGSLGVYGILLAGWSRNSKYAFLGCCRSVAQMISYELPMGLIVLTACMFANSLNWSALVHSQENSLFLFPMWPMAVLWFVCSLAELNRAPMDLPEAERELVAGYNVEYASMGFALFFIREYRNMIAMRTLTALLFLGGGLRPFSFLGFLPYSFWLRTKRTAVVFCYIWVRATLPRYKYNQLMALGWKRLLPLRLAGFVANAVFVFCAQSIS